MRDVVYFGVKVGESREEGKGNELLGVREDECGRVAHNPSHHIPLRKGPEMTGTKHHQGKNSNTSPLIKRRVHLVFIVFYLM